VGVCVSGVRIFVHRLCVCVCKYDVCVCVCV